MLKNKTSVSCLKPPLKLPLNHVLRTEQHSVSFDSLFSCTGNQPLSLSSSGSHTSKNRSWKQVTPFFYHTICYNSPRGRKLLRRCMQTFASRMGVFIMFSKLKSKLSAIFIVC